MFICSFVRFCSHCHQKHRIRRQKKRERLKIEEKTSASELWYENAISYHKDTERAAKQKPICNLIRNFFNVFLFLLLLPPLIVRHAFFNFLNNRIIYWQRHNEKRRKIERQIKAYNLKLKIIIIIGFLKRGHKNISIQYISWVIVIHISYILSFVSNYKPSKKSNL